MRQGLGDAIHLVVMLSLRKAQQLYFKLRQERCSLGEKNKTGLELLLVDIEPPNLVVLNRDWLDWSLHQFFQLLNQDGAHRCILNEDDIRPESLSKRDRGIAQTRIQIAAAREIEQVVPLLVDHQPGGAYGPVVL